MAWVAMKIGRIIKWIVLLEIFFAKFCFLFAAFSYSMPSNSLEIFSCRLLLLQCLSRLYLLLLRGQQCLSYLYPLFSLLIPCCHIVALRYNARLHFWQFYWHICPYSQYFVQIIDHTWQSDPIQGYQSIHEHPKCDHPQWNKRMTAFNPDNVYYAWFVFQN